MWLLLILRCVTTISPERIIRHILIRRIMHIRRRITLIRRRIMRIRRIIRLQAIFVIRITITTIRLPIITRMGPYFIRPQMSIMLDN